MAENNQFGRHEVLHMAAFLARTVASELAEHPQVKPLRNGWHSPIRRDSRLRRYIRLSGPYILIRAKPDPFQSVVTIGFNKTVGHTVSALSSPELCSRALIREMRSSGRRRGRR